MTLLKAEGGKTAYQVCICWLRVYGDRRLPMSHPTNREYIAQAKRAAFKATGFMASKTTWGRAWDFLDTTAKSNGWTQ